ncbi:MAG: hypothetical protein ACE5F1_12150 [Planctomycetota bacterium]
MLEKDQPMHRKIRLAGGDTLVGNVVELQAQLVLEALQLLEDTAMQASQSEARPPGSRILRWQQTNKQCPPKHFRAKR